VKHRGCGYFWDLAVLYTCDAIHVFQLAFCHQSSRSHHTGPPARNTHPPITNQNPHLVPPFIGASSSINRCFMWLSKSCVSYFDQLSRRPSEESSHSGEMRGRGNFK
jgi:hypothetical protein